MDAKLPNRWIALALLVAGAWAAGCKDAGGGGGGGVGDGPAFLVGTRFFGDTTITSYFEVVPSLEAGTPVSLDGALEVGGPAKLFAVEGLGWLAIGDGDAPTITRYTLDERGALVRGASMSLQAYGVGSLWDTLYVVSPTKAYYPDRPGAQLIAFDPTTMEVTGTIDLAATFRDGYLALYGYKPIIRGDKLLFSVGWFDWAETDTIRGETGLVVIDTRTDQVERVDVDGRCGGITQTVITDSGDAILVSSALAGAAHRLGRLPTAPCALRVRADADALDPEYLLNLGELTGGAVAGEPIPGGGAGVFLRVLDDSLAHVGEGTLPGRSPVSPRGGGRAGTPPRTRSSPSTRSTPRPRTSSGSRSTAASSDRRRSPTTPRRRSSSSPPRADPGAP